MNKKIIVTGGCGFIGSHTSVELQNNGYDVVLIDDLSNAYEDMVDRVCTITGIRPIFERVDLKEEEETLLCFEKHKDAIGVIHFAAHKAVGESKSDPIKYYENNFKSLIHVLKGMQLNGISNIIFSSSATVYGLPEKLPIREDLPTQRPFSPYGNTKKVGEEILEDVIKCGWLRAISLRYFNPIGAHESGNIGELPQGTPNNLMPYITQTAIGKLEQLQVFGNDYPTKDGTPIRDYIHVVDLALAHVKALEYLLNNQDTRDLEIFNLGTGEGSTVMEVIKTFERVSGQELNYKVVERREGDVPSLFADGDKASKILGWEAKRDLEKMIEDSWNWEQKIMES
ncbi:MULTISPECIES: UDP-glucose 4-epimerase GalE [unclassified Croceitalea]|uniref:UDP-glucose 4-epimerase GalE n=1 Tax=unclassified Croceitalea TaxID=2632280 RepID=UPI0030DAA4F2